MRAESGISSLEALRGKSALIQTNTGANLAQIWLDTVLHEAHLAGAERLFGSLNLVATPSAAVLPVFFGKADVAVVGSPGFAVMKEMNPQLGAKLRTLRSSPTVIEGMICTFGGKFEFREELIEAMRDLHLDVEGKQILMAFKIKRLVPVDKLELEQVRAMWSKHLLSERAQQASSLTPGNGERRLAKPGGTQ